jgi:hypothetical protein
MNGHGQMSGDLLRYFYPRGWTETSRGVRWEMTTALPTKGARPGAPDEAAPAPGRILPSKVIKPRFVPDEFFGQQKTSTSELPNPEPLIENLTRCVIEILAGARELEQIARWVTEVKHC